MDIKEINALLHQKKYKEVHQLTLDSNPVDLAELLNELEKEERGLCFRLLEKDKAAEVFSYMDNDIRKALLKTLSSQNVAELFEEMYVDDAVDFLEDMPSNVITNLLDNVDVKTRNQINQLLHYSKDSAGSIMTVEFIELYPTMSVKQALDKIRRVGIDSETVYTCYVVEKRKCLGIVTAKDLMIHDPETLIQSLMKKEFIFAQTHDDREDIANKLRKYGLIAIPVLDAEGCIVGIVTFDDAIDVLTDETTEDMQKMAAMMANDKPYLSTSVLQHAYNRIGWLLILMLSATITGSIISRYEHAFEVLPILVSFIPMLMDTGGNCGSQSSTLVIRGLAIDEIKFKDIWRVLFKEFRVSLVVGCALALANGLRIFFIYKDASLAIVVAVSLMATIVIAKIIGCCLPILAKKLKLDPAIMAAPLITTIVDTCSIMVYFSIATIIFKI